MHDLQWTSETFLLDCKTACTVLCLTWTLETTSVMVSLIARLVASCCRRSTPISPRSARARSRRTSMVRCISTEITRSDAHGCSVSVDRFARPTASHRVSTFLGCSVLLQLRIYCIMRVPYLLNV
jgi:hypothetical protein